MTESNEPRYAFQDVQKIIAAAAEIQARYKETMTQGEIETLAKEMGIEAKFVQSAVAQMEADTTSPAVQEDATNFLRPLTRRQKAIILIPASIYLLTMPLTFLWPSSNRDGVLWLYMVLPGILAVSAGFFGRGLRVGGVSGLLFGFAGMTAALTNSACHNNLRLSQSLFIQLTSIWVGSGIALGICGVGLYHCITKIGQHQRSIAEETPEA